jgi:CheY-like chemotaxis protein
MRILIVEDESKTAAYLRKGLSEHGFVVDVAAQGDDGLHLALTGQYDLIILDVMLPQQDGWSIMAEMRRYGIPTPVLFLTARDAIHDRVKGLELGADDVRPGGNPSRPTRCPPRAADIPVAHEAMSKMTYASSSGHVGVTDGAV